MNNCLRLLAYAIKGGEHSVVHLFQHFNQSRRTLVSCGSYCSYGLYHFTNNTSKMRVCLIFLALLQFTFSEETYAIKVNAGIKAYDISKTMQFVWDALMRWYKERVPDRDPPGEILIYS